MKKKKKKSCVSVAEVVLRHSFPYGKDVDGKPKFRMKHPEVEYVMNRNLTRVIRVLEVEK